MDGIKARILALIRGEGLATNSPDKALDSPENDATRVAVDEGFVYISHSSPGMQTEDGDYVMYGHVAIPALLHQDLFSRGIRPKDIQLALDQHDSNPDHAIDWLLNQHSAIESTKLLF